MQFRYPNITDSDPRQQLRELKAYLYQLVDQLNYTLAQLEKGKTYDNGKEKAKL